MDSKVPHTSSGAPLQQPDRVPKQMGEQRLPSLLSHPPDLDMLGASEGIHYRGTSSHSIPRHDPPQGMSAPSSHHSSIPPGGSSSGSIKYVDNEVDIVAKSLEPLTIALFDTDTHALGESAKPPKGSARISVTSRIVARFSREPSI